MGREFVAEPIWEDDIIDLGERFFKVILIPGHTPGGIALLDAENKILIGGDSIGTNAIFMFGPGRNIDAYIQSMKKLTDIWSSFNTIYPSHGDFPVDANIVKELITGAEQIRNGKIEGTTPPREVPADLYESDRVKFLYNELDSQFHKLHN